VSTTAQHRSAYRQGAGCGTVERHSVRYAARAQPLDWLSDRDDHMSTVRVSIDLPPTRRAPWATRRVLRRVLRAGVRPPPSWTLVRRSPMSPSPPSRTSPLSTPWSASWPGPGGGSVCRWPTAPGCAGSWATATTGTRGGGWSRGRTVPTTRHATWTSAASVPAADRSRTAGHRGNPDRVSTAAPAGSRRVGDGYAGCTD